jgi:hypothetical protein
MSHVSHHHIVPRFNILCVVRDTVDPVSDEQLARSGQVLSCRKPTITTYMLCRKTTLFDLGQSPRPQLFNELSHFFLYFLISAPVRPSSEL